MRQPNFFIVGAPKCGTTALNDYLKQHPQIFIPNSKDISFFGTDLRFLLPRLTRPQYLSLFSAASDEPRVGEASVWYLYSNRAAVEIKEFCPSAAIIIMLRNPVEMLYSQHSEFLYNCNEDLVDFEAALAAEEDRKCGVRLPKKVHLVEGLFYRDTAKYTEQVKRYFRVFGRENVHVIIYDDFRHDTAHVVKQTLQFLDVQSDVRLNLNRINPNKVVRSTSLQEFLVAPPTSLIAVHNALVPRSIRGRLMPHLRRLNTRYTSRPPLAPDLKRRLQQEFTPEVERLSELLGRDLTGWCRA